MAKQGIGEKAYEAIRIQPGIKTSELEVKTGFPAKDLHSRLRFLEKYEGGVVISSGDPKDFSWTIGTGQPPWERRQRNLAKRAEKRAEAVDVPLPQEKSEFDELEPLDPTTNSLKKGDKLLLRFPEEWRPDELVSVDRVLPDGVASCWSLTNSHYTYVDVRGFVGRGMRIARVAKGKVDRLLEKLSA